MLCFQLKDPHSFEIWEIPRTHLPAGHKPKLTNWSAHHHVWQDDHYNACPLGVQRHLGLWLHTTTLLSWIRSSHCVSHIHKSCYNLSLTGVQNNNKKETKPNKLPPALEITHFRGTCFLSRIFLLASFIQSFFSSPYTPLWEELYKDLNEDNWRQTKQLQSRGVGCELLNHRCHHDLRPELSQLLSVQWTPFLSSVLRRLLLYLAQT